MHHMQKLDVCLQHSFGPPQLPQLRIQRFNKQTGTYWNSCVHRLEQGTAERLPVDVFWIANFLEKKLNMFASTLFFFLRYEFNEPFSLTPHLWGWMSGSRVQNLFEVSDTNTKFEHVPTWETNVKTNMETEIDKHSFAIAFSETVKIAANFCIAHIGRKAHTPYSSLHYLSGNGKFLKFQSNVRFCRDLGKNTTYPFSSELEHVW